ncbi:hypothetical protein QP968_07440 [Corynebacterium sp. MSK041]|uniref:hypothetical protein n=1 Tax=Corynebacterium sp. MSK041 TaxID=3050194 RepID=UPI00254D7864|nr:hypothetical protein [Corynebacterium sp. MSK041]MDK8795539.1 hypothetical protein [Corynebacterium sp. MSK041]
MEPMSQFGRHRRRNEHDVEADDAFLTSLSHGVDPSDGADELASLLLGLRDEVEAPMPAAPLIDEAVAPVTSLTERRAAREASRRFRTSPWMAGLVGAAAATVAVAGTGAALYSATPGSVLWGPSQAVFGERKNVVELATKLDEIENMTESGNLAGAKLLIDQLRESMNLERGTSAPGASAPKETVVVTPEPEQPSEEKSPETVTVTLEPTTVTVVVTEQPSEATATGTSTAPSSTRQSSPAAPTTTIILQSDPAATQSSQ